MTLVALVGTPAATAANTTTTPKIAPTSGTITVSTGDVVYAWQAAEHAGGTFTTAPTKSAGTATIGTFASIAEVGSGTGTSRAKVWKATVTAGGTLSVSLARTGTAVEWQGGIAVVDGTTTSGEGTPVTATASGVAPSLALTTTTDHSAIFYLFGDWSGSTGARTYRQINSTAPDVSGGAVWSTFADASHYGVGGGFYKDTGSHGSKTAGLTAPTAMAPAHIAFEILPAAATPTATPVARVGLASAGTPTVKTLHSLHARARIQSSATATLKMALYEGSNNRSGDLETSALTTSLANYTLNISDAAAATITDYSALEVRFWGVSSTGETPVIEVADIYLELPVSAGGTSVTVTPTTETDAAQAIKAVKRVTLTAATETETATAVTKTKTIHKSVTAATETGSPVPLVKAKAVTILPAQETDTAVPASISGGPKSIIPAAETDAAVTVTATEHATVTPASETDTGRPVTISKPIHKAITPATGAETAPTSAHHKTVPITAAAETDTAPAVTVTKTIQRTITPAGEADMARAPSITHIHHRTIIPAAETDIAIAVTIAGTVIHPVALDTPRTAILLAFTVAAGFDNVTRRASLDRPSTTADVLEQPHTTAAFERPAVAAAFEQPDSEIVF